MGRYKEKMQATADRRRMARADAKARASFKRNKYPGPCSSCGAHVPVGSGWWRGVLYCDGCGSEIRNVGP
jgi:hypothetical protein